jgi:predicted TIM-barrel fold metal-dependent hydrolase
MGIDQVLVIPNMFLANLPYVENADGVSALCRAYNNWLVDFCAAEPERLFGAGIVALQDPGQAATEVRRMAGLGHRVGLVRPIDALGTYPNSHAYDVLFRAFEETGVCLGMHTFPPTCPGRTSGPKMLASPGEFLAHSWSSVESLSFAFEAQDWLVQVLLSGFLDRYPDLKMLVFESNSQWLPYVLATCDRLFKLFANERETAATRLPSEAFAEQCMISFESDEDQTFRQWERFEDIGIWASDCYHHDGADAWSAIRSMRAVGVPDDAERKLMGANARRMYGIEPKMFVTEEAPPIDRPAWFPQGPEFEEWAELIAHPRENAARLRELDMDPQLVAKASREAAKYIYQVKV